MGSHGYNTLKRGKAMKIEVNKVNQKPFIHIDCDSENEKHEILCAIDGLQRSLRGSIRGQEVLIKFNEILYIDSVDKHCFFYTQTDCFETQLRLYELEELMNDSFIRISKSCIVNLDKIKSLKADMGSRIIVTLENDEKLIISRQYNKAFKERLKGKRL